VSATPNVIDAHVPKKWRAILSAIPGYDPFRDADGFTFDPDAAEFAIAFFEECLTHVKGALAGKPFLLEKWQKAIIANLFGWKDSDGLRRYREALIFVPRKNGKSLLVAGIANLMLFCDGEPGAECYCLAAEAAQAALVFDMAKSMIHNCETLEEVSEIFRYSVQYDGSTLKPINAQAGTKHGLNTHFAVFDELHAQPTRELVDVILTSTGSRQQPLVLHITTSDYEREGSICNEKHDYASKVRDGVIKDARFLPVIYEASIDDDWQDRKTWAKANPNMGVSFPESYLETACQRAQDEPSFENTFKRLHLNIRTEQAFRWLQMEHWNKCDAQDLESLAGRECYGGLDLASTSDLACLSLAFPSESGHVDVLTFPFVPSDNAQLREKRDKVPYLTWSRQGFITLTEGNVIDYRQIRDKINELGTLYALKEIAFDPWGATQLVTELGEDGFDMVEFRQGFASMSAPSKEFERLVKSHKLRHGDHPVFRWCASNVTATTDPADNIKPDKKRSSEKIDCVVAAIMAIGRIMVQAPVSESVYATRGVLEI
jgi:phage terminase large subunit-like protein